MIGFTLPWVLIGLVAAALPLLLHLVQHHEAVDQLFPAVRYLQDAARAQQRRLRFQHWLLLLVRTLLIVALVLAAAGATWRHSGIGPHAPSALVLLVDNSAPSGAVVDGEPVLAALVRAANQVLDRATASDRLWLVTADGVVRAGSAADLRNTLTALHVDPIRWDLGHAVTAARQVVRASGRPGGVVVVTSLPSSALTAIQGSGSLLVLHPEAAAPANRGITQMSAGVQPWGPAGGRISLNIVSSDTAAVPVTLAINGRAVRELLVVPGVNTTARIGPLAIGWLTITATLPPDEFRLDDSRSIPVQITPPAAVTWDPSDRFLNAAAEALVADGRIRRGSGVHLGDLGPGPSILFPPSDAAQIPAVNRQLQQRGATWRFGTLVTGAERVDSGAVIASRVDVTRRVTLEPVGHDGDLLATVGGAPWLVRTGNLLLLGSRPDPAWTTLPLSAEFVPLLDAMLTRSVRGDLLSADVVVGEPSAVGSQVTTAVHDSTALATQPGPWTPTAPGAWFLLTGHDTVGALAAHSDPRVSNLVHATNAQLAALWPGSRTAPLAGGAREAFAFGGRGDLRGVLLGLALACALVEMILTGAFARRAAAV
ncbi:MAG TPA: VWA domain-containing protein [Gemmatimonadales bacterium]